jgi:aspartate dehydrogenase
VAPGGTRNLHDVEVIGEFGRMTSHIENVPSATNPRTGKLSYLSAIAMLKEIVGAARYGN